MSGDNWVDAPNGTGPSTLDRGSYSLAGGYIEDLGVTGVNIRCHELPGKDPNYTISYPDRTSTDRVGNSKVNNQVRVSRRQDINNKYYRYATQMNQE